MVNGMIGTLAAVAAEPRRERSFGAKGALTGISCRELSCAFEPVGQKGIMRFTGCTPPGGVESYRTLRRLSTVFRDTADYRGRTELFGGNAVGLGTENYAVAFDACVKALRGICMSDITLENKPS